VRAGDRVNIKSKVKKNFAKAIASYDRYATLQLLAGRLLLKRLSVVPSPQPILDLGSGTGTLLCGVRGVVALDISREMALLCKERGFLSVAGDGEFLPFKSETFKTVFSNFSLQWMNPKLCAGEVFRVLKHGGYALISVPVKGSLAELLDAWSTAYRQVLGEEDVLFEFPSEEDILTAFSNFELLEFERATVAKTFTCVKEALKSVNRTGARNPYRNVKVNRQVTEVFKRLFRKEGGFPVVFKVLLATFYKRRSDGL
jgi:malonyl-CoA O-methyltransferase